MAADTMKLTIDLDAAQALTLLKSLQGETKKVGEAAEEAGEKQSESWAQVATGLKSSIDLIKQAGAGLAHIAQLAAENERTEMAIARLGTAWEQVKAATDEVITTQQALKLQQTFTNAGMRVTGEQLATIARTARDASTTTEQFEQNLEQLAEALSKGEQGELARFNISLTSGANRVQNMSRAIGQMRDQMNGAAPATRTMTEEIDHAGRSFGIFTGRIGGAIAEALDLKNVLRELGDLASGEFAPRLENISRRNVDTADRVAAVGELQRARDQARARGLNVNLPNLADMQDTNAIRTLARVLTDRSYGGNPNLGVAQSQVDRMIAVQSGSIGRARNAAEARVASDEQERLGGAAVDSALEEGRLISAERDALLAEMPARRRRRQAEREARRRGWRPEGETAPEFQGKKNGFDAAALSARFGEGDQRAEALREATTGDTGRNSFLDDIRSNRSAEDQYVDEIMSRSNGRNEYSQRLDEMIRSNEQANDLGRQFREQFISTADIAETQSMRIASSSKMAFDSFAGSFKAHLGALIEGKETIGEAMRGIVHETTMAIAQESAVKSLYYLAQGIAASVTPGLQAQAAGFFTASAIMGGVAVGSGVIAGLTTAPAQAAAEKQKSFGNDKAASVGSGSGVTSGGPVTYVINMNGALYDREGFETGVGQAITGLHQRGAMPMQFARAA